jgi:hypothetical protein
VITPVLDTIVAIEVLLLLHAPPVTAMERVEGMPTHTLPGPVMEGSDVLTVTVVVAKHPAASVYEIVAVPEPTALTTPVDPTVATEASLVLQLPPVLMSLSVEVEPAQSVVGPVMPAGIGLTVTTTPVLQPVGSV